MARHGDRDDYGGGGGGSGSARSVRNGRHSGSNGEGISGADTELDQALATVLEAFPSLCQDLCESCQSILENRLIRLTEGGSTLPSTESKGLSRNTRHDQQQFRASDGGRKADSGSTNFLNSSSDYQRESVATSGEEEFYDQSVHSEESHSSSYVNVENSGNGSDVNSWGGTRKKLHYPEKSEEHYEDPTSWPALGSSNRKKKGIQERLRYEDEAQQNGESIYNVKPARWSNRGSQHLHGGQERVAPYRNAVKKLSNSSSSDTAGTTPSGSRGSIYPASVWKSTPNNSAVVPRATLTEASEERSSGLSVSNQDNNDPDQRERMRFRQVVAKKDFELYENVDGRKVNILQGLELHTNVLNAQEQEKLIAFVLDLQSKGRKKELMGRTYSEPRKWMRGKGRVTIQFGCCYNYALDKAGNPPGIVRDETVDPLPSLLKATIRRLVRWHVLPPSCVPDSCIINIYDEGDCIPPHIDHHDFVRPFCTLSLLSQCNIVFGSTLKIIAPGEFEGSVKIPLPVGSVLILNGNGADVAKHAVPAVPSKRISITFRKMDPRKVPNGFIYEKDLQNLTPL